MDWLRFIAAIVRALVWPVAVVVIAILFRPQLQSLLARVRRGKVGPAEFEFEQDMQALVEQAAPNSSVGTLSVAVVSPNARIAVVEAWLGIEAAAYRLAYKDNPFIARNPVAAIRQLEKGKLIPPEDIALLNDLRALRNQAAHDQEFSPSQKPVSQYVQLAHGLAERINRVADQR